MPLQWNATIELASGAPSFDETNGLWRIAAVAESYADNDDVILATDLFGNGFDWTAISTDAPTFKTNQINGHPAFRFSTTIPRPITRLLGPDLSGLGLTEIDLFVILWIDTDPPAGNQGLWVMNNRVGAHSAGTYTLTDGTLLEAACLSGATDIRLSVNPTPSLTIPRLYRVTAKTGTNNYELSLDGTSLVTGTRNTLEFPGVTKLGVSENDSAGISFTGYVADFFAFSQKCDATQFGTIRDSLNDFYGLSIV